MINEVCGLKIKDEIELLRELLNKAIENEAGPEEILRISQMLDKLIVEYMIQKWFSYRQSL
ncbi:MAG: aspartyl-phosphate phosphatase Spo0E family protein [Clostridiales bacterium]|nr:aspartyl-phosphate phosphatase Spo0E family protein [Clostridiales bacterium]